MWPSDRTHALSALRPGARGRVVRVRRDLTSRADRLAALGVGPGALIRVLQTFPGIVIECDQTELAIERLVGGSIWIALE
jgi:DtxR family Mn-dependent transcriptional regulator